MTDENTTAAATEVVKPKREKRHGQTRPETGTKTGLIWDIADRITKDTGVVATKEQVWDEYKTKVDGPAEATVSTQYGRWVTFSDYQEQVKAARKAAKDAKSASETDEKERKKAEREAAKQKKADERAAKKAEREAAKAAKEAKKAEPETKDVNSPEVAGVEAADQDEVELPEEEGTDEADEQTEE